MKNLIKENISKNTNGFIWPGSQFEIQYKF